MLLDIITSCTTIIAVIVAMFSIHFANKNSKQQILTNKLEELYEAIQLLSWNYEKFMDLYFKIEVLHDNTNNELRTMNDYFAIRDQKLSEEERNHIIIALSRIEILARCYTRDNLLQKTLKYVDLMSSFAEFVFNTGSIRKEINWENGFPNYDQFYTLLDDLKKDILSQLKIDCISVLI